MAVGIQAHFHQIDGKEFVELINMTDRSTVIHRADAVVDADPVPGSPDAPGKIPLYKKYAREYDAYQSGRDIVDYGGTPLTDIPGMSEERALQCKIAGIHNVEMLAETSDIHADSIGMGGLALRDTARLVLRSLQLDRIEKIGARVSQLEETAATDVPMVPRKGAKSA